MIEVLRGSDLFEGLAADELQALESAAQPVRLAGGELLFLLGDPASCLYVVAEGTIELCFPLPLGDEVRDITIEKVEPGKTLGWSALVRPYRFTLSARAAQPTRVIGFGRNDLHKIFETQPRLGYMLSSRISELVGLRLMAVQALWARCLRRTLNAQMAGEAP